MQTGLRLSPSARMLLLSNSRDTSGNYLVHARDAWADIAKGYRNALFFPFAGTTVAWDDYLALVRGPRPSWWFCAGQPPATLAGGASVPAGCPNGARPARPVQGSVGQRRQAPTISH